MQAHAYMLRTCVCVLRTQGGCAEIAKALAANSGLQRLNLDATNIDDAAVDALCKSLHVSRLHALVAPGLHACLWCVQGCGGGRAVQKLAHERLA